jgi:uncharacterized membrane protein
MVGVFLPTTPNPTSGYLLVLPEEDVVLLDMSVAEGIKLIISLGSVVPSLRAPVKSGRPTTPPLTAAPVAAATRPSSAPEPASNPAADHAR